MRQSSSHGARAARIESGDATPPSFEVMMARKGARPMIEKARRDRRDLCVMPGLPPKSKPSQR